MSAPITFEGISPKLEPDKSLDLDSNDLVTTTLSVAIKFVTALESREQKAFPEDQQDPSVIDERGEDAGYMTRKARSMGYTGPEIREGSSSWVKLTEGEEIQSPLTLRVKMMRSLYGKPAMARYQQSEQRERERDRISCIRYLEI